MYGKLNVLAGINFDVRAGEFVCVVGPSGCGKSTLIQICGGLLKPRSGSVEVDGQELKGPSSRIGVIFQDYGHVLLPWRTVLGNVELGLELGGKGSKERKDTARSFINLVGLAGFESVRPSQLSGGMKQRVQIARVLSYNPKILLMDEPFGSLDAQTKILMQQEFLEIWRAQKKSILFVTHDIDEAIYLADRVIVMSARPTRVIEDIKIDYPRPRDRVKVLVDSLDTREKIWKTISKTTLEAEHLKTEEIRS